MMNSTASFIEADQPDDRRLDDPDDQPADHRAAQAPGAGQHDDARTP